jgi:cytochrome b subunit of formate dehydrogenase
MFDYINIGFMFLSGIILFMAFILFLIQIGKSVEANIPYKVNKFMIVAILFAIGAPLYNGYNTKAKIEGNIKYFNKNIQLECFSGFALHLVSVKSNWKLNGDFFEKEDLLIRADKCTQK